MNAKIPTIKQCRYCDFWYENQDENPLRLNCHCQRLGSYGWLTSDKCESWRSAGLLPEVYVDANAQEVDDAEYVPEWWQTGEAGVVTAQLVRRGKRRRIRRVRMAVRWVDAS